MKTDIQIARECKLAPIGDIAKKLAIPSEDFPDLAMAKE